MEGCRLRLSESDRYLWRQRYHELMIVSRASVMDDLIAFVQSKGKTNVHNWNSIRLWFYEIIFFLQEYRIKVSCDKDRSVFADVAKSVKNVKNPVKLEMICTWTTVYLQVLLLFVCFFFKVYMLISFVPLWNENEYCTKITAILTSSIFKMLCNCWTFES